LSLKSQRRLAAKILNVGETRVWVNPERIDDVATAITREDIRKLVHEGVIHAVPEKGVSRARARILHQKKIKGLRRKHGSRKGKKAGRMQTKLTWTKRVRAIRRHLRELRSGKIITKAVYRDLYHMAKGGAFKSVSHLEQHIQTNKLGRRREK
jgi:large subunit ribosomal protein L19e